MSRDDLQPYVPKAGGLAAQAQSAVQTVAPHGLSYLEGLNAEQRDAVETLDGPLLVLAGAGTGKTRVLTTRIAHILATRKAFPGQILAVTFTNKAAREMKGRIGALVGDAVEGMPWLGTFHMIGTKILRRHAELAGLHSNFTILDTDDQIRLIKQLIQAAGVDEKRWPARVLAGAIDGWKNRGLSPDKVPPGEAKAYANGRGGEIYSDYQDRLKTLNACDFGDLLVEPIRILQGHPDILKEYQEKFRYILVDEYQDTNVAQYLWLRLLAQGNPNICCVGDDDQSIYGWRGAEVENILRFERDFPGAKVIRLECNYRSTTHILAAASHVISHNEGRLGKTLYPGAGAEDDAEKVTVASAWDSEEEARGIGEAVEDLQRHGHDLKDMAILVRASFQMREFEERFITLGLNYRVIGGPRFYERKEIRDALAYFRVVVQPSDDLAFERIFNVPKRGLGEATLKLVHAAARAANRPLLAAARMLVETEELKPQARRKLGHLVESFDRWSQQLEGLPHTELAEIILDESGYTEMWQTDRSADAPGRLENLKELVQSMDDYGSMADFLEHISLVMDAEQEDGQDAIFLMTLHSAKGLEFDTVFLPGWEEALFPSQRTLDESGKAGLEEERRLAYVGITRARKRAKIWFASNRRIHGLWQASVPSRFVDELPSDHVEIVQPGGAGGGYARAPSVSRFETMSFASGYSTPGWQRAARQGAARQGRDEFRRNVNVIEGELVAKSVAETPSVFETGMRVFHQKFGYGIIKSIEGNKLTIDFDKAGQKRVLESFVEEA